MNKAALLERLTTHPNAGERKGIQMAPAMMEP